MGMVVLSVFALAIWVVIWSLSGPLNLTSFDGILIAAAIILLGAAIRRVGKLLARR